MLSNGRTNTEVATVKSQVKETIRYDSKSSAVAEMGDRGHNRHGLKRGGCCPFHGQQGPRLYNLAWAEV